MSGSDDIPAKCQKLLSQVVDTYSTHMAKEKKYHQDLRVYHDQLETMMQEEDTRNSLKKKFHESQYIEWKGKVLSCMNCTQPVEAEKCRCQQMYGQRPHLATIRLVEHRDSADQVFDQVLTREMCQARGHLDNHNIEQTLCLKHLEENNLHYRGTYGDSIRPPPPSVGVPPPYPPTSSSSLLLSSSSSSVAGRYGGSMLPAGDQGQSQGGGSISPPTIPVLILPSITCGPCRKEFETLEGDFSHENISAVNQCIEDLKMSNASNASGTRPDAVSLTPPPPQPLFLERNEEEMVDKKSKVTNILLIAASVVLLAFSLYLVYCIVRNLPYDLVCTRTAVIQQVEQKKFMSTEDQERDQEQERDQDQEHDQEQDQDCDHELENDNYNDED